MTGLQAAAQQALEALENAEDQLAKPYSTGATCAITALRAALAEPVQEPVAVVRSVVGPGDDGVRIKWLGGFPQIGDRLYAAPPQRKPLTEDKIEALFEAELLALPPYPSATEELPVRLARAIEQAHGIGSKT